MPIPKSLVALLRDRRSKAPHSRWIFVNRDGKPENHFLRKLKRIAKRAGLNCGQCKRILTTGRYEKKRVEVSCKDHPVCEHFYLHRFRKTCATRWVEASIPVRTIQAWLGHKNLETTMIYLGVTDSAKLRGRLTRPSEIKRDRDDSRPDWIHKSNKLSDAVFISAILRTIWWRVYGRSQEVSN